MQTEHPYQTSQSTPTARPGQTTAKGVIPWLCLVNALERMGYYGFRSIFVFFLMSQTDEGGLAISQTDALAAYGEFTLLVYMGAMVGGLLGDVLLGAFRASLAGLLLMGLGYVGLTQVDAENYFIAFGVIAFGSGLFKPGIAVMIAQQLRQLPQRLDAAFTAQYLAINLGAAMAPLIIGLMAEQYGWSTGFFVCAVICTLAFVVLLLMNKRYFSAIAWPNFKVQNDNSLLKGVGVVLVVSILSGLYWLSYEVGQLQLYNDYSDELSSMDQLIGGIVLMVACVAGVVIWSITNIASWYKIAASLCLFALGWSMLSGSAIQSDSIAQTLMMVAVLHAVAEVLLSPILMALIARYGYMPLMGVSFGVFFYSSALTNQVVETFADKTVDYNVFTTLFLFLGGLVAVVCFVQGKFKRKKLLLAAAQEEINS